MAVDEKASQILDIMSDTFGPSDPRFLRAQELYDQLNDDDPMSQKMALGFLEWAITYPNRLGVANASFDGCRECPGPPACRDGWVAADGNSWSVCRIKRPMTAESVAKELGKLKSRRPN